MFNAMFNYFKTGPDAPPMAADPGTVARVFNRNRWQVFFGITFGYALFYVIRLCFSVIKMMVDIICFC